MVACVVSVFAAMFKRKRLFTYFKCFAGADLETNRSSIGFSQLVHLVGINMMR